MSLNTLKLFNFRNYTDQTFQFSPSVTLVVGPNASGKTNLLEAIYLLATSKSFRARNEAEMINWDGQFARVNATVEPGSSDKNVSSALGETRLDVVLTRGQLNGQKIAHKQFRVNGHPRRRLDFLKNCAAVLFHPSQLEMVTHSPFLRRFFLDEVLSSAHKDYAEAAREYSLALRQRNKLLDRFRAISRVKLLRHKDELNYWDEKLIAKARLLQIKRQEFLDFVNRHSSMSLPFQVKYLPNKITPFRLQEKKVAELAAGMTLIGPQRDDFALHFYHKNNSAPLRSPRLFSQKDGAKGDHSSGPSQVFDLSRYGSRSQQRLAVLFLKLGHLQYLTKVRGQRPLLLLDDIFSELDQKNRHLLLNVIPHHQTFITTTNPHLGQEAFLKQAKVIELTSSLLQKPKIKR